MLKKDDKKISIFVICKKDADKKAVEKFINEQTTLQAEYNPPDRPEIIVNVLFGLEDHWVEKLPQMHEGIESAHVSKKG